MTLGQFKEKLRLLSGVDDDSMIYIYSDDEYESYAINDIVVDGGRIYIETGNTE